jgi:hypothetical protein
MRRGGLLYRRDDERKIVTIYTLVLFVHAIAVFVLTAVLSIEAWMLFQLRRAPSPGEIRPWTSPVPGLTAASIASLIVVFVTGASLTQSLLAWDFAWPRFAVLGVVLFALFGAFTGRRLRAVRRLCAVTGNNGSELVGRVKSPFLKVSLSIRIWIVIGVTLITAAKTGPGESLGIVVISLLLGVASALVPLGRRAAGSTLVPLPSNYSEGKTSRIIKE